MTTLTLNLFRGEIPRASVRHLPETFAHVARNARLTSGALAPMRTPRMRIQFDDLDYTLRYAYPARDDAGQVAWLTWDKAGISVVEAPLVNDAHRRLYWTGDGAPKYTTFARLQAGQPPFELGVPAPEPGFTVTASGGESEDAETRSYVLLYVTSMGEEGPPTEPITVTGVDDDDWTIGSLPNGPTDGAPRDVNRLRIYRTVVGESTVEYFRVAELPLGGLTEYVDNMPNLDAVEQPVLVSTSFAAPPAELQGLCALPNGYLAGFVGRDIYFSEPYRPHAWPEAYVVSVPDNIVGLGVSGSVLMVMTEGVPYAAAGVNPAAVALRDFGAVAPCVSAGSIVEGGAGVYYASPEGLMLLAQTGASLITRDLIDRHQWNNEYLAALIQAAQHQSDQYFAIVNEHKAFLFNPRSQESAFVQVDPYISVTGLGLDRANGRTLMFTRNAVWELDPIATPLADYEWVSREYVLPRPVNFGAVRILVEPDPREELDEEDIADLEAYNAARAAHPLDALNHHPLGGVAVYDDVPAQRPQYRQPLGGSPLYNVAQETERNAGTIEVFADRRLVLQGSYSADRTLRLPSGFKARTWQVRLLGTAPVYAVKLAETRKELMDV